MTVALWCILVACFIPVVCAGLAKGGEKQFDNANPRAWLEGQTGWRQRADWAQRNHYEVFPPFAAAVLVAQVAHAPQLWADILAVVFLLLRVGYSAAYMLDRPSLRSALWSLSFACIIALFAIAA